MTTLLFGRFDAAELERRFEEVGVCAALEHKGFTDFKVDLETLAAGIPHIRLSGAKSGTRWELIDARLTESAIPAEFFRDRGFALGRPAELLSVYWIREQDPSREFSAERPPLPLQQHPGLGVLRNAFQVAVGVARDLQKDGIACIPKFYHDAVIFYRSRLFLFLEPGQQGRFEALARDLRPLSLGTASMLLLSNGVQGADGTNVDWGLHPQVCPLSPEMCDYFNSKPYADAVAEGFQTSRYTWSPEALATAQALERKFIRR